MTLIERLEMQEKMSVGDLRETLIDAKNCLKSWETNRVYAADILAGLMAKAGYDVTYFSGTIGLNEALTEIKRILDNVQNLHESPNYGGDEGAIPVTNEWLTDVADFLEKCHYIPNYINRPVALETASKLFGGVNAPN